MVWEGQNEIQDCYHRPIPSKQTHGRHLSVDLLPVSKIECERIMSDSRYKVTEQKVREMRAMRSLGMSYNKIAEAIGGISWATAYYWCNPTQRQKQRAKNAQRRHTTEENAQRIPRDMARRKKRWAEDPNAKLAHEIRSALSDTRCNRKSVQGIPIEEAKELLESGALDGNNGKLG